MRKLFVAAATVAIFALLVSPAFAGKGGNGNGKGAGQQATVQPSIRVNESDPHLGGTASFTVAYPDTVKNPLVAITCLQNGVTVYHEANVASYVFTLGGGWSMWLQNGGSAGCAAELYYFDSSPQTGQVYHNLAWTTFEAAG